MERAYAANYAKLRALVLQYKMPGAPERVLNNVIRGQPPFTKRTVAVGWLRDPTTGQRLQVVSTSGDAWDDNVVNALKTNEIMLTGSRVFYAHHAEINIMNWANQMGYQIIAIGAGRNPCPPCQAMAKSMGVLMK
ncbi:hypothetical protein HC928_02000 [bacterium]|nr:hypothetical protein [bacterium]